MWVSMCDRVRPRLPLLAGGELIGPDRRLVERHLIRCAACRRRLEGLRGALDTLHAAADVDPLAGPPPSLWPALARQIRESRRAGATWDRTDPRVVLRAGAALAAACLLGVVATLSFRPTLRALSRFEVRVSPNEVAVRRKPTAIERRPQPIVQRVTFRRDIRELPAPADDEPAPTSRADESLARYPASADARMTEPTR